MGPSPSSPGFVVERVLGVEEILELIDHDYHHRSTRLLSG